MGKFGKKRKLETNPLAYTVYLMGVQKAGKTTLVKEVCEKVGGDESYIMAELKNERGADAIEGAIYENLPTWGDLEEMVDDIHDNKTSDYPELKVIVFDTLDQLIDLSIEEAIRIWNRKNPDKKGETINSVWGSYGRGEKYSIDLIDKLLLKLHSVGVKTWFIGHVKNKEVTDVISGDTYTILTSDQQSNFYSHFKKQFDIIALMYLDKEMVKEQVKDKFTGKTKSVGKVTGEARKIRFRDSAFVTDTGSRFAHIEEEIEATSDNFIKAIEDAIKAEIESKGGNVKEREKENKSEEKALEEKVAKKETELKEIKSDIEGSIEKIISFMKENKSDKEKIAPLLNIMKDDGFSKPMEIDSPETIQKLLDLIEVL